MHTQMHTHARTVLRRWRSSWAPASDYPPPLQHTHVRAHTHAHLQTHAHTSSSADGDRPGHQRRLCVRPRLLGVAAPGVAAPDGGGAGAGAGGRPQRRRLAGDPGRWGLGWWMRVSVRSLLGGLVAGGCVRGGGGGGGGSRLPACAPLALHLCACMHTCTSTQTRARAHAHTHPHPQTTATPPTHTHTRTHSRAPAPAAPGDSLGNVASFDRNGKELWEKHVKSMISQVGLRSLHQITPQGTFFVLQSSRVTCSYGTQ